MLEPEQSGFEKNRDCGAAIFPVAQLIEFFFSFFLMTFLYNNY
jgi:hypothetical protein